MSTEPASLLPPEIVALAERVVRENAALGRKVVLAESCTGGLVAGAVTEVAGSSRVLEASFVTYSNEAKQALLGVPEDIIDAFGAVSVACAWAMAEGALKRSGADVAVAVSGIAGPDGGSAKKPVGLVVFARAVRGADGVVDAEEKRLSAKTRAGVRAQAVEVALELLLP
ncbi:MAG: CinA family protein [Proteobacteria bacterium]|nr:CinA family protein [Pseudomonadota bacterium]